MMRRFIIFVCIIFLVTVCVGRIASAEEDTEWKREQCQKVVNAMKALYEAWNFCDSNEDCTAGYGCYFPSSFYINKQLADLNTQVGETTISVFSRTGICSCVPAALAPLAEPICFQHRCVSPREVKQGNSNGPSR